MVAMKDPCTSSSPDANGITFTQRIACSASGAFLTAILVTPMDVVKVRMQSSDAYRGTVAVASRTSAACIVCSTGLMDHVHTCGLPVGRPSSSSPWFVRPLPVNGGGASNNGAVYALRRIVHTEGMSSLWSGLSPTLLMAIPTTVLYFSLYDDLLVKFREDGRVATLAPAFAATAVTVVSPIEMLRTKLMSERMTYRQLFQLVAHAVRTSGPSSLWLGWTATILRDAPFSIVYWMCYDAFKRSLMRRAAHDEPTFGTSFVAGATAGSIAALLTQPFDVVKTRMQIAIGQAMSAHTKTHDLPSSRECAKGGTWRCAKDLYRTNGLSALYTGTIPRLIKVAPACAIMIGTYEFGKVFFRHRNQSRRPP